MKKRNPPTTKSHLKKKKKKKKKELNFHTLTEITENKLLYHIQHTLYGNLNVCSQVIALQFRLWYEDGVRGSSVPAEQQ